MLDSLKHVAKTTVFFDGQSTFKKSRKKNPHILFTKIRCSFSKRAKSSVQAILSKDTHKLMFSVTI